MDRIGSAGAGQQGLPGEEAGTLCEIMYGNVLPMRRRSGGGMDYGDYVKLLERYQELDKVEFGGERSEEALLKKLMDISYEKKQIQKQNNAILREYVEKYEKDPSALNQEGEGVLGDFLKVIMPEGNPFLDIPIAFRVSKLLLEYYQAAGNLEQSVIMLELCTVFDITIKEHLDDYEGSTYARTAESYLADFDRLSERAKRSLVNCWLLCVVNRKDMTFGLRKYREIREQFEPIRHKMGVQFMAAQYAMCKMNALAFALEACRRAGQALKYGVSLEEPMIDMEREAPLIEELAADLSSEEAKGFLTDRVLVRLYCVEAAYHLGKIHMEELLSQIEACIALQEDYSPMEQCTALFTAGAYYLDYLYKCSRYEKRYVVEKSKEIVERALASAKEMVPHVGDYQTNSCVLMLVNSASNIVDFDFFKNTVLHATVYANKALYVHTMMVKEICHVLVNYILEENPRYLDGVAGYDWKYCADHKEQLLALMENCSLFHDIGKYFCLDYVSNSSRNLTEDEFEIIKVHPANFSKVYQGQMTPEVACIRDCALLHHLWFDGKGGYPRERHTCNQPFVDMISIADSLDAATDNIGRPYGLGKTLEQLMEEFDSQSGTRYSGYIAGLLHEESVKRKIAYIINEKRKEIYCDIYLSRKGHEEDGEQ